MPPKIRLIVIVYNSIILKKISVSISKTAGLLTYTAHLTIIEWNGVLLLKKIKNLFGNFEFTWLKVIIFAVLSAVLTAGLNLIPELYDTSFQDIAINLEAWILFALFIIVNCKTVWEAMSKCFVYFLISQPLIYLFEAFFKGFEIFRYYGHWFVITLLTIPGAAIAYLVKKKNLLGVLVLAVATAFLGYMGATYFKTALSRFPNHIISAIFCIALAIFLTFVLFEKKSHRAILLAVTLITAVLTFAVISRDSVKTLSVDGFEEYTVSDSSVIGVSSENGNIKIKAKHDGHSYIDFTFDDGSKRQFYVSVSGGSIWVDEMTE